MKLLDARGRLFGKINIVDFLIVVLILIIIPTFFYIYKILAMRPTVIPHTWIKIEAVTFTIPELAGIIKAGDVAYHENGHVYGRILKILKREDSYKIRRLKSMMLEDSPRYKHMVPLFLEMELLCAKTSKYEPWYFNREPLFIGLDGQNKFSFNSGKYKIFCYVLKFKD